MPYRDVQDLRLEGEEEVIAEAREVLLICLRYDTTSHKLIIFPLAFLLVSKMRKDSHSFQMHFFH